MSLIFLLTLLTYLSQGAAAQSFPSGVIATGTMGTTNPPQATMGTQINQTSMARLLSVNSISVGIFDYSTPSIKADTQKPILQDFCVFAPPYNATIGDSEVRVVMPPVLSLLRTGGSLPNVP
jgi:hypothetical protein